MVLHGGHYLKPKGSVCIGVHAKHMGCICSRHALYVAHAGLKAGISCRQGVPLSRGEGGCQGCWGVAAGQQVGQQNPVIVVCHSAAVVDLACDVL